MNQDNHNGIVVGALLGVILIGGGFFALAAVVNPGALQRDAGFGSRVGYEYDGPPPPTRNSLDQFPVAENTWSARFSVGSVPPEGKFHAYYFDTEKPDTWSSVTPHTVDSIDLQFAWYFDPVAAKEAQWGDEFVQSENFGAYWTGVFTLAEEKDMDLNASYSWAQTRVVIDGKVVLESNNGSVVPLRIPAGTHLIEVEHSNDWHTEGTSVALYEPRVEDLSGLEQIAPVAEEWQVNMYHSSDPFKRVFLTLSPGEHDGPIILALNSYDTIHWDLSEIPPHTITAVVVSSFSQGADVRNAPEGTHVFYRTNPYLPSNFNEDQSSVGSIQTYNATAIRLPGGSLEDISH